MSTVNNLKLVEPEPDLSPTETLLQLLADSVSRDNAEFNGVVDEVESLQNTLALTRAELKATQDELASLKQSAATVISNAEKIQTAAEKERAERRIEQAELRELRKLDPKRLAKVNKELKAKNAELKESNTKLDATRREALKQHKMMLKKKQDAGILDTWVCPETGDAIRVTSLTISKTNEFGGVPGTPVLEYFHKSSGVTRQGCLNNEGGMSWGTLANSLPNDTINLVAKQTVVEVCQRHKIKIPKEAQ